MSDIQEMIRVLELEAQAILDLKSKNAESFVKAIDILFACQSKVILTGIGKSGVIARKIAATLSSTGTPSLYLHPAESAHGDMGVITESDVVWAISYGGESAELAEVLKYCERKNIPLLAMTAKSNSSLGTHATVVLDVSVAKEACPLGLAPTSSTTATLALGDAVAMALLKRKGFNEKDFGQFHPGGVLGRRLLTKVDDLMHKGANLPFVKRSTPLSDVITIMTSSEVRGIAGVLDDQARVVGVITDGDIRRRLQKSIRDLIEPAEELMGAQPKTITPFESAERALYLMEKYSIQSLFVVNNEVDHKVVGILHLQDLLKAKIR